jgi:hypothetical protein
MLFISDGQFLETLQTNRDHSLTLEERSFAAMVDVVHVLSFITGASEIPATGFIPRPRIRLVHEESRLISANTCSNELTLIVNENTMSTGLAKGLLTSLMNGGTFSTL